MNQSTGISMEESMMGNPANDAIVIGANATERCATSTQRKPYAKPVLEPLGDIRDVTMAGSLGKGESGMGGKNRKP